MNNTATLISEFHTIYYLSGFEVLSPNEREAVLILINNERYIVTDARYAGYISPHYRLIITQPGEGLFTTIQKICNEKGVSTLIYQSDNLTEHEALALKKLDIQVKGATRLYTQERSIKTKKEIEYIREACRIGDTAFSHLIPTIHTGQTEKDVAWRLEKIIREDFQAELSFDPIIAVDTNAAIPHYNTKRGEGIIQDTSILLIDFGVKYKNYCSDITRMVCGKKVGTEVVTAYHHLRVAQEYAIKSVNSANQLRDIDAVCRKVLTDNHYPSFPHSTGHGIGLDVHEAPRIHTKSEDIKQFGQVFTVEPGIYFEGKWGMRLEDTVVVTQSGSAKPLTRFPKELVYLR